MSGWIIAYIGWQTAEVLLAIHLNGQYMRIRAVSVACGVWFTAFLLYMGGAFS